MFNRHQERGGYTELIIDAEYWRELEPKSIAAVFYPSTCTAASEKGRACRKLAEKTHAQLLTNYGVSAEEVPLLRLDVQNWREPFHEVTS